MIPHRQAIDPPSPGPRHTFPIHLLIAGFLGWALLLQASLSAQPIAPPTLASLTPAPGSSVGSLFEVEVVFSAPVIGIEAADLLVNGQPARDLTESAPGQFVFSLPPLPAGPVAFEWSATHGIVAADSTAFPFLGQSWTVTLDATLARRQVLITEFMADNDVVLYDDDCDRSDWIELHNAGSTPVELEGWSLTDDASLPGKWRFPAFTLQPESYLIVFASEKNKTNLPTRACRTRSNSMAGFHTNFRLNPEGEYLALIAPDGEVVSAFAPSFPPQRRDVSYGRAPGSPEDVGYLTRPTPRAANATSGDGFAAEVRFSRPSGPFLHPFLLALTTAPTNAVIRFTTDGSFPAETNSRLQTYTGPLPIATTTQIRARAYQPGLLPGAPASETYLRLTNDAPQLASLTSSLPIVVITTLKPGNISASRNTPVHLSLFEPQDGLTTLLSPPTLATRGGAKTRGSSTGGQPQSNLAIEWWDEFDQDTDHPVLGMPANSEWVLYAPNEFDAALIHNPFTMELSRQMNFAAPRTRFVEVYLNKGGSIRSNDWFGLYVLMEKPGLSKGRINAPKADPEDVSFPEITGSYLFKTDRLDPGDTGFTAAGGSTAFVEPKEREMKSPQRAPQLAYLTQYFRDFDNALRSSNPLWRDPVRGYRGYIELTNWIDFHVLELLSGQVDAIRLSTYFYKRRSGKIEYGPRWDYDRAWESKGDSRDNNPRVWDTGGGLFAGPWWNRVLSDRDAWQLWIDRWHLHRQSVFSQSNMFALIDAMTNEIRTVQPRENRRWSATAPRINYPNEIRIMKTWISNRLAWIDSQFAQPPLLSSSDARIQPGFQLSLQLPTSISQPSNVAIFYTLDGTDPRPPGGTSTPTSLRYSTPITLTTNTRVIARTRDLGRTQRGGPPATSTWSAPAIATFTVEPLPLLITEIHFHPTSQITSNPATAPDLQFVELLNPSTQTLNLSGCRFVQGIEFHFAPTNAFLLLGPGQRCLLVADAQAFATRHPNAGPVAGQFSGDLSNAGERLTLLGPAGETLLDFTYTDDGFPAADGLGFSLVLSNESTPAAELGDPRRWRTSTRFGGSPGQPDPTPAPTIPRVLISEVMAAPTPGNDDWVELFNPGSDPVDVGGWWLSDAFNQPQRIRIPFGWNVPAQGYLVIPASVFNPNGGPGFAFSAGGDEAWLFSANTAGELTGWVHGFSFGPSPRGSSIGRTVTDDTHEQFTLLSRPTRGLPNAAPAVGPLVISEIAPQRSEAAVALEFNDAFVELLNVSPYPVTLVDPTQPSSAWSLAGDLTFDFAQAYPEGASLTAGGRVVCVGFDPNLDRTAAEAFRTRYHVLPDVPLVGPWRGHLAPSGVHLQVLPPGTNSLPETDTPPANSDTLHAVPSFPWPLAGFTPGASLSRTSPTAFGNTPTSWIATWPTPGEADTDFDGLPDRWETAHQLQPLSANTPDGADHDPDADGASNRAEWLGGSDPLSADDGVRLRLIERGWGRLGCLVSAAPGSTWTLEAATPTHPLEWQPLRTGTIPPEGTLAFPVPTRPGTASLLRLRRP